MLVILWYLFRAKDEQLSTIYQLMQDQQEKFGGTSMDDLHSQMKLYGH